MPLQSQEPGGEALAYSEGRLAQMDASKRKRLELLASALRAKELARGSAQELSKLSPAQIQDPITALAFLYSRGLDPMQEGSSFDEMLDRRYRRMQAAQSMRGLGGPEDPRRAQLREMLSALREASGADERFDRLRQPASVQGAGDMQSLLTQEGLGGGLARGFLGLGEGVTSAAGGLLNLGAEGLQRLGLDVPDVPTQVSELASLIHEGQFTPGQESLQERLRSIGMPSGGTDVAGLPLPGAFRSGEAIGSTAANMAISGPAAAGAARGLGRAIPSLAGRGVGATLGRGAASGLTMGSELAGTTLGQVIDDPKIPAEQKRDLTWNAFIWSSLAGTFASAAGEGMQSLPMLRYGSTSQLISKEALKNAFRGIATEGVSGIPFNVYEAVRRYHETGDATTFWEEMNIGLLMDMTMGSVVGSSMRLSPQQTGEAAALVKQRVEEIQADPAEAKRAADELVQGLVQISDEAGLKFEPIEGPSRGEGPRGLESRGEGPRENLEDLFQLEDSRRELSEETARKIGAGPIDVAYLSQRGISDVLALSEITPENARERVGEAYAPKAIRLAERARASLEPIGEAEAGAQLERRERLRSEREQFELEMGRPLEDEPGLRAVSSQLEKGRIPEAPARELGASEAEIAVLSSRGIRSLEDLADLGYVLTKPSEPATREQFLEGAKEKVGAAFAPRALQLARRAQDLLAQRGGEVLATQTVGEPRSGEPQGLELPEIEGVPIREEVPALRRVETGERAADTALLPEDEGSRRDFLSQIAKETGGEGQRSSFVYEDHLVIYDPSQIESLAGKAERPEEILRQGLRGEGRWQELGRELLSDRALEPARRAELLDIGSRIRARPETPKAEPPRGEPPRGEPPAAEPPRGRAGEEGLGPEAGAVPLPDAEQLRRGIKRYFSRTRGLPEQWMLSRERTRGRLARKLQNLGKQAKELDRLQVTMRETSPGAERAILAQMQGDVEGAMRYELPREITRKVEELRMAIDAVSEEYMLSGIPSDRVADIIEKNLGIYTHRFYRIHNEKAYARWLQDVFDGRDAAFEGKGPKEARRLLDAALQYLHGSSDHKGVLEAARSLKRAQALREFGIDGVSDLSSRAPYAIELALEEAGLEVKEGLGEKIRQRAEAILERVPGRAKADLKQILDVDGGWARRGLGAEDAIPDLSNLKRRKDVPEPLRDLFGEVKDWRPVFAKTVELMESAMAQRAHLEELLRFNQDLPIEHPQKFVWTKSENEDVRSPKDLVELVSEGNEKWGPLDGHFVQRDVRQVLLDSMIGSNPPRWVSVAARMAGAMKAAYVVFNFPAAHVRNALSNVLMAGVNNGINGRPRLFTGASKLYLNRGSFQTRSGVPVSRQMLQDMGLFDDNPIIREFRQAFRDQDMPKFQMDPSWRRIWHEVAFGNVRERAGATKKIVKKGSKGVSLSFRAGDEYFKVYGVLREMESGYSLQDSVDIVKNTLPSYDRAWLIARNLGRFPITSDFPTFFAEVIRTSLNTIKFAARESKGLHPLRDEAITPSKARMLGTMLNHGLFTIPSVGGIATAGSWLLSAFAHQIFAGEELEPVGIEQDKAIRNIGAAPWEEFADLVHLGWDPKKNETVSFNLSYINPYAIFGDILRGVGRGWSEDRLFEQMVKAFAEGLSPFTERSILVQKTQEVLDNRKILHGTRIWNPELPWYERSWEAIKHLATDVPVVRGVQRLSQALDGHVSRYGRTYNVPDQAAALLGIRPIRLNPREALGFRAKDWGDRLRDADDIYWHYVTSLSRQDPEEAQRRLEQTERARKQIFREVRIVLESARRLGIEDFQLRRIIRDSRAGIRMQDLGPMLRGQYVPFSPSPEQKRALRRKQIERRQLSK